MNQKPLRLPQLINRTKSDSYKDVSNFCCRGLLALLIFFNLSLYAEPVFLDNQEVRAQRVESRIKKINAGEFDQFEIHGFKRFSPADKDKLKQWIKVGVNATRDTLGVYPSRLIFHLVPKKSNQPVPWAYTRRDTPQRIYLHVDSRFQQEKFINDWTIYHEISHLAIPYLGGDYAWLAEGFASFMQYQVMANAKVLTGTIDENYKKKITPHLKWFKSDLPPATIARRLMSKRQYPSAYWGSAYFFVLADNILTNQHQTSLTKLISQYQLCCNTPHTDVNQLMSDLDVLLGEPVFSQLLARFETQAARLIYPNEF
ncbi:hypothetical protein [Paraglaciecola sp. L1A13]|uniref:hypothetical protein n=1 Tax=Paraglaciecola sp. L1A13 TaxID=2686359 RepID=UPI001E62083B|nr:hypothetical protein [Paraglaciecola sp. L1A13]